MGWTFTADAGTKEGHCTIYDTVTGTKSGTKYKGAVSGTNPKPVTYTCTFLSTVTGKKTLKGGMSGQTTQPKTVSLFPSWPASSPWVTAVGATRFVGQKAGNEEMATDQFGSGGGFSTMFGQSPDAKWQSDDVAHYLKVVPKQAPFPPTGSFPPSGRGTPDVSALGEGYQVLQSGHVSAVGGTSASAPAFAGMVSLLNEARLNKGGKPLGFLNPFLYQNAAAFTDVTKGTNAIGRGTGPIPYGFNCTEGWDPATGIGTPKFDKLLAAAMK
jgi:tripeptidyl-peptidase-1